MHKKASLARLCRGRSAKICMHSVALKAPTQPRGWGETDSRENVFPLTQAHPAPASPPLPHQFPPTGCQGWAVSVGEEELWSHSYCSQTPPSTPSSKHPRVLDRRATPPGPPNDGWRSTPPPTPESQTPRSRRLGESEHAGRAHARGPAGSQLSAGSWGVADKVAVSSLHRPPGAWL